MADHPTVTQMSFAQTWVDHQGSIAIPRLIPQSAAAAQMANVARPTGTKVSTHVQVPPAPYCSH